MFVIQLKTEPVVLVLGTYAGLDRFGRVKQQLWRDYGAGADRDKYAYGYDRNSNRTYRWNPLTSGKDWKYHGYDNLDRLTEARLGTYDGTDWTIGSRQGWDLDAVGNWAAFKTDANDSDPWAATQSRDHNLVNELTSLAGSSDHVGHDAAGNMTKVPVPGSETTSHYTCTYDAWNRLVETKSGTNVVLKCRYDGVNRRVKKHINTSSPLDQTYDEWWHFYYNRSWQVLETRRSTDGENTHPETLQPEEQYVWSLRYIDAPVLRDRNTDTDDLCDDERLYYLTDANMNVTSLVDTGGDAVERYVYDPYGKVTIYDGSWSNPPRTTSSYSNEILYCGYRFDPETGMYHVRHREYHPTLGRWGERDSGYYDGYNLYEVVQSNPLLYTDSHGQKIDVKGKLLKQLQGRVEIDADSVKVTEAPGTYQTKDGDGDPRCEQSEDEWHHAYYIVKYETKAVVTPAGLQEESDKSYTVCEIAMTFHCTCSKLLAFSFWFRWELKGSEGESAMSFMSGKNVLIRKRMPDDIRKLQAYQDALRAHGEYHGKMTEPGWVGWIRRTIVRPVAPRDLAEFANNSYEEKRYESPASSEACLGSQ